MDAALPLMAPTITHGYSLANYTRMDDHTTLSLSDLRVSNLNQRTGKVMHTNAAKQERPRLGFSSTRSRLIL